MMKKEKELLVAVASQKGGVGKSVFTVLLASVLHYRKDGFSHATLLAGDGNQQLFFFFHHTSFSIKC